MKSIATFSQSLNAQIAHFSTVIFSSDKSNQLIQNSNECRSSWPAKSRVVRLIILDFFKIQACPQVLQRSKLAPRTGLEDTLGVRT